MIQNDLFRLWTDAAPALGNHLWQSTLFAATAGALTLTLKKHSAQARYGLWLVASVKFLIPFSLLTALGGRLSWLHVSSPAPTGLPMTMMQVGRPFSLLASKQVSATLPAAASLHSSILPTLAAIVWACGCAAVLGVWFRRWRKTAAAMRAAVPLEEGREVEALRCMERVAGIRASIGARLSQAQLEPGIIGLFRPVLLWPQGISSCLEDAQLEAILAHELWHVRRRDNLTAAIHQVVTALFWFHPLLWWMGARLAEERERACDEQVLTLGSDREVYARSVLKACEFCVASPVSFVSGITGADLKSRIVRIMTLGPAQRLGLRRKLLLAACAVAVIAGPIGFGILDAPRVSAQAEAQPAGNAPAFEIVSVEPSHSEPGSEMRLGIGPKGFSAKSVPLSEILRLAYGVNSLSQLTGMPDWARSQRFDIDAKMDDATVQAMQKLSPEEAGAKELIMIQALLADRFKLQVRQETKEIPVYALMVAEGGIKMKLNTKPLPSPMSETPEGSGPNIRIMGPGQTTSNLVSLNASLISLNGIARMLSKDVGLDRPVVDRTGLTGNYDFTLSFTPEPDASLMGAGAPAGGGGTGEAVAADSSGTSIFSAIQEQLGLKLEPRTEPMPVIAVEHIEEPSPK